MIYNREKLVDRFSHWPAFHDAEIIKVEAISNEMDGFALSFDFYVFELTDQVDNNGYFLTKNDTLTTIKFDGVRIDRWNWSCQLDTISNLEIEEYSGSDAKIYRFKVDMPSVMGGNYGLSFLCKTITVIEAVSGKYVK